MFAIIIVHFGEIKTTADCIASLRKFEKDFRLIIVDNGTGLEDLEEKLGLKESDIFIQPAENIGFGSACNLGLRKAVDEKIVFLAVLNNDTLILSPFLDQLRQSLRPGVGAVSPLIMKYPDTGVVWFAGGKFNRLTTRAENLTRIKSSLNYESDFLSGCCFMTTPEVVKKVGLFDSDFFFTYEDVDWCLRARKLGYKLLVVPSVKILHQGGVGSGGSRSVFGLSNTFQSQRTMIAKHTDYPLRIIAKIYLSLLALKVITMLLLRGDRSKFNAVIKGLST
ncbi:hypothetical protein A3A70_03095 [candidate division WWE3 bacterium RIFCSPLOWO2_01_FULL_42_11]|uniref:Glycosyltransferase 2-like domain-containing protein n=1 Tax=candidate division WWE3 bacterium RIFCSPLOWO2_01_FULL_42_11 TaxID=1802627 RepID=A0A1F4VRH9_UNCKA|nr:MAG: hypothetical protein A3A70_03095 [candidate division WWE3 bacterium RIFCSPLOWO2_01_FULL_42_11]